ncbi:signal peptide peptidase SppA [Pasteurella langaaensis]|uniref:signal peptide peptidase SppA n=1 Tax=Alitibacter langaaensis TaxID=756 RepID=UPI000E302084|nr:signal peptide peptidase SppA [Pasteurella langaaensis]
MWNVLKWCWKGFNFIRDLVMNIFFLVFMLFVISVFSLLHSHKSTETLEQPSALLLNLNGYLADNRDENMKWQTLLQEINGQPAPTQISTFDVVYAINHAAEDEKIKGLVLDLNYFEGADLPALDYLGSTINRFKQSGKPVIAYADNYSQAQYYLASFADQIYLNPVGDVGIQGFSAQHLYFKSMMDKLEVTPHVFRVGTYKSAVEPFLRDDMSPDAKQNTTRWLNQMWNNYKQGIAQNRHIPETTVLPATEQYLTELKALGGNSTKYVMQRQLVTALATPSELSEKLTALFGQSDDDDFQHIDFDSYLATLPDRLDGIKYPHNIAVINVEGTIIDGESYEENVGGDSIVALLRKAQSDDRINGVILRVNSPGGSAFASEKIRQETEQLQKLGKPVVVSMGSMAASGGYWISSTADYIVADKNTITGSIGIFSMLPTFEKTLKKAGISTDGVSTSPFANVNSLQTLPKAVSERFQAEIEHGYDAFLEVVSRGRKLSKIEVDKVAQGQVWLGQEALQHKLVDELGNMRVAVEKAKALAQAKLATDTPTDFDVVWLTEEATGINALLNSFKQESKALLRSSVSEMLGLPKDTQQIQKELGLLTKFNDPKGQYLYCLNCANIK